MRNWRPWAVALAVGLTWLLVASLLPDRFAGPFVIATLVIVVIEAIWSAVVLRRQIRRMTELTRRYEADRYRLDQDDPEEDR